MASEVGTAFVSILPSLKGFSSRLRSELAGELRTIDPVVGAAGERAGRTFGDRMHGALSGAVTRIGSLLKTGLVVGSAAAVAGLGALTVFGLKSAAALEQTTIGIEALVGSTQEATKFIGELQQFSAKTPFEFAGVADASRRILAFGQSVGIAREQVIPTLTTIGDLVSVLGGSQENIDAVIRAFGQIASKGRLMGGEVLQLSEALPGFNVNAAIAAKLGVSVADSLQLQEAGAIDAKTAIEGVLEGMAKFPGAAGAMEKQSQTLLGVWSTFKDTIGIALTNAFQPVIPAIKTALSQLTPIIGAAVDQLAPALGGLLGAVLPLLGDLVSGLSAVLTPILEGLSAGLGSIGPVLTPIGQALGAIVGAFKPLLPVLGLIIGEIAKALVPILIALTPVIEALIPPIIAILDAFLPLLPVITQLIVIFAQILTPIAQLTGLLVGLLASKAVAPLLELIAKALLLILDPLAKLTTMLDGLDWGAIGQSILNGLGSAVSAIGDFFSALPGRIGDFLASLPGVLINSLATALQGAAFAVGFGIGKILAFFRDLPSNIYNAAIALVATVGGLFTSAVETGKNNFIAGLLGLLDFVRSVPGRVIELLMSLPGRLVDLTKDLAAKAYQLGKDIIAGVIDGIKNTIGNVGSVLKEGFGNALSGLKKGLGIGSPSKVYAEVGADTIAGYVKGVEDSAAKARVATLGVLGPAAASPASTAATSPTVRVSSSDPIVNAVMDQIRNVVLAQFGGNVNFAFSSER